MEIIDMSSAQAMGKSRYGNLKQDELQSRLDTNSNGDAVIIDSDGSCFIIKFTGSQRCYEVDKNGNTSQYEMYVDTTPGELAGSGSENEPFRIECIEDLVTFAIMTKGGDTDLNIESNQFSGLYVTLERTLNFKSNLSYNDNTTKFYGDLNGDGTVEDIKTELTKTDDGCIGFMGVSGFKGSFDGKNHEIKNIYMNSTENIALFVGGTITVIKNLGITGNIIGQGSNVAGIFAASSGYPIGSVSLIENCWNSSKITGGTSTSWCAGIVARDCEVIRDCYNTGNITNNVMNNATAGGISSDLGGHTIENCYNTGNITSNYYTGGIASGHGNGSTTVKNCYNTGNITGGTTCGGILGCNGDVIENCFNTGIVQSNGNQYCGGICGSEVVEIKSCYNTGDVTGNYVGGICNRVETKMINCYNIGKIINSNQIRRTCS